MVHREKTLPIQSSRINTPATEIATHVNRGYLIKSWCLAADLRVARSSAIKDAALPTDVEIAVAIHIERSENWLVRDVNRRFSCDSGIGRTIEKAARTVRLIECLVLEVMPRAAGLINCKPLFVASDRALFA